MEELMYVKFINKVSRHRILMHVFFWLAVTIFFFFVFNRGGRPQDTLLDALGFMPGHMIFVYSLNYFLFPRYVLKGKMLSAVLGLLVILAISLFYMRVADVYLLHYSGYRKLWIVTNFPRGIFAVFSVGWIAVSIKLVKRWYLEAEVRRKLEKEKLIVELQLLKSQLHPHFLFNTLNSLYSLTLENSPQAPQIVLKLSALLRYILYECNTPYTLLSKEIENIRNYIELEQNRFRERLDISLSFTGDIANRTIAPLLLLPFVENSIKHGIGEQLDKSWVHLHLHVEADTLTFRLINSRDDHPHADPQAHGLGLQNVQRRLNLLYPGLHTLKLVSEEDTYMVFLTLRFIIPDAAGGNSLPILIPTSHETQVSYS
jgi:sensor histidine kinase YesM